MKLFLLVAFAGATFAAGWEAVEHIESDRKIEVVTQDGKQTRGVRFGHGGCAASAGEDRRTVQRGARSAR